MKRLFIIKRCTDSEDECKRLASLSCSALMWTAFSRHPLCEDYTITLFVIEITLYLRLLQS